MYLIFVQHSVIMLKCILSAGLSPQLEGDSRAPSPLLRLQQHFRFEHVAFGLVPQKFTFVNFSFIIIYKLSTSTTLAIVICAWKQAKLRPRLSYTLLSTDWQGSALTSVTWRGSRRRKCFDICSHGWTGPFPLHRHWRHRTRPATGWVWVMDPDDRSHCRVSQTIRPGQFMVTCASKLERC